MLQAGVNLGNGRQAHMAVQLPDSAGRKRTLTASRRPWLDWGSGLTILMTRSVLWQTCLCSQHLRTADKVEGRRRDVDETDDRRGCVMRRAGGLGRGRREINLIDVLNLFNRGIVLFWEMMPSADPQSMQPSRAPKSQTGSSNVAFLPSQSGKDESSGPSCPDNC